MVWYGMVWYGKQPHDSSLLALPAGILQSMYHHNVKAVAINMIALCTECLDVHCSRRWQPQGQTPNASSMKQ